MSLIYQKRKKEKKFHTNHFYNICMFHDQLQYSVSQSDSGDGSGPDGAGIFSYQWQQGLSAQSRWWSTLFFNLSFSKSAPLHNGLQTWSQTKFSLLPAFLALGTDMKHYCSHWYEALFLLLIPSSMVPTDTNNVPPFFSSDTNYEELLIPLTSMIEHYSSN